MGCVVSALGAHSDPSHRPADYNSVRGTNPNSLPHRSSAATGPATMSGTRASSRQVTAAPQGSRQPRPYLKRKSHHSDSSNTRSSGDTTSDTVHSIRAKQAIAETDVYSHGSSDGEGDADSGRPHASGRSIAENSRPRLVASSKGSGMQPLRSCRTGSNSRRATKAAAPVALSPLLNLSTEMPHQQQRTLASSGASPQHGLTSPPFSSSPSAAHSGDRLAPGSLRDDPMVMVSLPRYPKRLSGHVAPIFSGVPDILFSKLSSHDDDSIGSGGSPNEHHLRHKKLQHRQHTVPGAKNRAPVSLPALLSGADCSESMLSDITISDMSTTFTAGASPRNSLSIGAGTGPPVSSSGVATVFLKRGEDLEQQRQQAPLSIEEDLFIYDDIVISKDEARTKHWRVAGRKPAVMGLASLGPDTGDSAANPNAAAVDAPSMPMGKRMSSGKSFFSFNDFDVCVDEMDLAPSSTSAANALEVYQRELANSSNNLTAASLGSASETADLNSGTGNGAVDSAGSFIVAAPLPDGSVDASAGAAMGLSRQGSAGTLFSMDLTYMANRTQQKRAVNVEKHITTINTVPAAPNTATALTSKQKADAPTSDRPLTKFTTQPLLGHATRVKCIALTPSEREFASCSNEDASVALSNLAVNDEVGIFTGHQDTVINATFSPDGKYLATTSKDKTMILWDVMTTKQLLTFAHAKVVICCCFGPDSKYLVSGCQDRICRLWDTRRGKEWVTYSHHEAIIISVAFSPCGGYVCSASADKTLRVWASTTARTRFTLTGHVGIILSCSYTADGKYIISNDESLLRVWSTQDGSCTLSLTAADVAGMTHLSPKGPKLGWTLSCAAPGAFTRYICVACNNRFVYILDRETGKEVASTFCKAPVYSLTSGTDELTACGDSFGNIYLLRMQ